MKTYEYHEGKDAQENFEEGMKALFQVPKDAAKERKKPARSGLKTIKVGPAKQLQSHDILTNVLGHPLHSARDKKRARVFLLPAPY